ncbi:MAG: hypothetical protein IIY98_02020 [Aeriscardovia sp.]|nr:hypothetical protein [Aeriscardovia sp.]
MSYQAPGVIVNGNPVITGSTAFVTPSTTALVCNITQLPQKSETVVISNGSTIAISAPNLAEGTITIALSDGTQLVQGTDYTVSGSTVTISDTSLTNALATLTYQYTPTNFYSALKWFNFASVQAFYGPAFNASGDVENVPSAAAYYAFNNGAQSVCIIPVYQPSSGTGGQTLATALSTLSQEDDISVIVPCNFQSSDFATFTQAIQQGNQQGNMRRGIYGITSGDASASSVQDMQTLAAGINSFEVMLIGNMEAFSTTGLSLPPYLYACAVAGVNSTVNFYTTLTNKVVGGFGSDTSLTPTEMNSLAGAGMTVINARNGSNKIRQSLTTWQSSLLDWSYGGVYNYLKDSVKTLFDSYVGQPATSSVVLSIQATLTLFLEQEVQQGIINSYSDASVQIASSSPDTVLVNFTATWQAPLNYIEVDFNFNTVTGTVSNS